MGSTQYAPVKTVSQARITIAKRESLSTVGSLALVSVEAPGAEMR